MASARAGGEPAPPRAPLASGFAPPPTSPETTTRATGRHGYRSGPRPRGMLLAVSSHAPMITMVSPTADSGPSSAPAAAVVMDPATAFAAVALAAVSWDGVLTMAGSRALRHSLDYRQPFRGYGQETMVKLMDTLLAELRRVGPQHLMVEAAEQLSPSQRTTAFAVAAEIMRSDGPLQADEQNILTNLATTLSLSEAETAPLLAAMDLLHADVLV